jgi:DnaK suppressor protein
MAHQSKQTVGASKDKGMATTLQRLLARHEAELGARRNSLRSEINVDIADPRDSAEWSSDQFACSLSATLLENTGKTMHDIEEALKRLRTPAFGTCVDCGGKIPKARLEALPFVETCRDCQELRDLDEKERAPRAFA